MDSTLNCFMGLSDTISTAFIKFTNFFVLIEIYLAISLNHYTLEFYSKHLKNQILNFI